ncbi:GtrA family protein [Aquincola sp. S2]|uniref:GtrA family protein n=1 Tax=Pseudaquabacterium terrae TaxID=2732868 RepID=A0ABX2EQH8_9BURK|nr:GtrA family protein [Aquabacterium terrae]
MRFALVGAAAAAVHLGLVLMLVNGGLLAPLQANVAGWIVALGVSFAGHRCFSFAAQRAPLGRAAVRFSALSAAGFVLNEAAYAGLLHGGWRYEPALAAVLLGIAALTYLLARHWAFRGTAAPPASRHRRCRRATARRAAPAPPAARAPEMARAAPHPAEPRSS